MWVFRFGRLCAVVLLCCAAHAWAVVDVNQAPPEDLMAIKGIGPRTSERIVQARAAGPFRDWPDFIRRVSGIGPATAAKLSAQGLTVNGRAWSADGARDPHAQPSWPHAVPRALYTPPTPASQHNPAAR